MVLNWNRGNAPTGRFKPGVLRFDSYLKWDWVQEACRGRSYELPAKELAWFQFMVKYRTLPAMRSHLKSIQGKAIRVEWEHAKPAEAGLAYTVPDSFSWHHTYFGWITLETKRYQGWGPSAKFSLRITRYAILERAEEPCVMVKQNSGGIYSGELNYQGDPHGTGTETYTNGSKYEGQYKDGKKHGTGTQTWGRGSWEGDRYEGQWKDGKRHGTGTYTEANGDTYEGQYKDGKRHGTGTYTWANGDKYEGQWQDDKMHGTGSLFEPEVGCYSGSFRRGERHGVGKQTYLNGTKYEGQWENGKKRGGGTWWSGGGTKYEGQWKNDKKHGTGTETYTHGKYEGQWENGKKHGTGTETYTNGSKYEGQWENDDYIFIETDSDETDSEHDSS